MMKKNIYIHTWIIYIFICLHVVAFTTGCRDSEPVLQMPDTGWVKMRFTLETPGTTTRADIQTDEESRIDELDILVFEDSVFRYKTAGIEQSGIYVADIRSTVCRVDFFIMANARTSIDQKNPQPGMSIDDVKRTLTDPVTQNGFLPPFVMCGKASIAGGIGPNTTQHITGIKLIRSVARTDVILSPLVSDYTLTSIQAFRISSRYQLLPNTINANEAVENPSIPSSTTRSIDTNQFTTAGSSGELTMYVPEVRAISGSAGTTRDVCLVLGVTNQENRLSYYRISFADNEGQSISILRNHRYLFQVTAINGPGFPTPEEAAGSVATNIRATITSWEESQNSTKVKGEQYFSVSARKVTLGFRKNRQQIITVNTNISDYEIQWSDINGDPLPGISLEDNDRFSISVSNDKKTITITAKKDNTGTTLETENFVIKASDWIIPMQIEQGTPEKQRSQYVNFLSFGSGIGSLGGGLMPYRTNSGNGRGFRELLLNTANFGPNGTVPLKFIGLDYTSGSDNYEELRGYLEQFDVVNLTWDSGRSLSDTRYQAIKDWQAAKPGRVLIIVKDRDDYKHFDNIVGEYNGLWEYSGTNTWKRADYVSGVNDYFFNDGPFGEVGAETTFNLADNIWMGMLKNNEFTKKLIPILKDIDDEKITMSYDPERNILYIGDSNLYQSRSGAISSGGNTDYAQGKLMANVFAFMIEEIILPAKLDPYN